MCGICGMAHHSGAPIDRELLNRMCDVLTHRGPDDGGYHIADNVGLGHRRLKIIDLSTGHQPLSNEDRTVWVVFNGEIYNFMSLRSELETAGHTFSTKSDTEVIVHLYEEMGEKCVEKLRGMFAFAIWDAPKRQLLLARDRLGKKPLYYASIGDSFLFASEMKSLLEHPAINRRIRPSSIINYIAYGYVQEPETIFEDIYKLQAGHYLVWHKGRISSKQYWDIRFSDKAQNKRSEDEIVRELKGILEESVRLRLVSDVPLGAFLSGGIDSSAVVALMARASSNPVKTFSIGFQEQDFNEIPYAREVAKLYATDHHEFIVKPDAASIIEDLVWYLDEPFGDSSAIPMYYVCKIARENVTVVLSGDGGDELFSGYERYVRDQRNAILGSLPALVRTGILAPISRWLPESAYGKNLLRHLSLDHNDRYINDVTAGLSTLVDKFFDEEFIRAAGNANPSTVLQYYFQAVADKDLITRRLYVDTKTYLPGDILTKVDRMSMAVSLEARAPLLDQELVEYVAALPPGLKLKARETKYIFRRAMEQLLPKSILNRKKMGFAVPISRWFNKDWSDAVDDLLFSPKSIQRGYFNRRFLQRLISEHRSGRRCHDQVIWSLMMLELWHRKFIDHRQAHFLN